MNIAGIYIRVSTQEQAQEGYSIHEQEERTKKYCSAMGWKVYKVYADPGFSGGSINRPALQQLIHDVKDHRINKVVVYKLDRLSRSQRDTLNLIEDVFNSNQVDFVSMSENFDTSSPFGRATIGILAVFAQLEREQIKERMCMGKDARFKTGKWMGAGKTPIGYDYKDGKLIVNDYEKMQVVKIFDLFLSGYSLRRIAITLNDSGLHNKYGKWTNRSVGRVLSSRVYLGEVFFKDQWCPGNHESIIQEDDFKRSMQLHNSIREKYTYNLRPGKAKSYLAGLMYCEKCGAKYHKIRPGQYSYYYCASRAGRSQSMIKDPNCKNKNWRMEDLDELVFNEIRKLKTDPLYTHKSESDKGNEAELIRSKISKIDSQMSKLMELYSMDQIPVNMLQDKIQSLGENKTALIKELDKIKNPDMSKSDVLEMLSTFDEVLKNGSFDDIRFLITTLIKRIDLNDEDVTIHWNF